MPSRRRLLLAGEDVLVDVRPHWFALIRPLATAVVVTATAVVLDIAFPHSGPGTHWLEGVAAAVPLVWLGFRFARWRTTSLIITSLRVIERGGLMSRWQEEVRLIQIERVDAMQTLLQRVAGTGVLEVTLRTVESAEESWAIGNVRKPDTLRRIINRRKPPLPGFTPVPR